jgi:UDP-2,3-diacylglucosamine pyrophosphatase LpxH
MNALVISDLHLESIHSHSHLIDRFLESLPKGYELVLNGDIIDSSYPNLPPQNLQTLELIRRQSYLRKVVWIRGNHDDCSAMRDRGEIHFARNYTIGNQLIITHGNELDKAKPLFHLLIRPFKAIQLKRIRAGLKPVNLARLAKRVEPFYRLYRWKLGRDAVRFARKKGVEAITCGHAHHPEDRVIQGVRYINTGAWTDYPVFYLLVNEKEISLNRFDYSVG